MIKKTLYPKTKRFSLKSEVVITEKLDGSNLGFYVVDGKLYIAQRNNIYALDELDNPEMKGVPYKGLRPWLKAFGAELEARLVDNGCIFGEWIAMGKIKYPTEMNHRFYQFAKANVETSPDGEVTGVKNIYYDHSLFQYSFVDQGRPPYIRTVPVVDRLEISPSIESLDHLYDEYLSDVCRSVEGFVVNDKGSITKYVRHKNGKLTEHVESYGKGDG